MVQLKDGDSAAFQRNVIYLIILGEVSACRGKPPAPCDTAQNVPSVPVPHQRPPCSPKLQTELWARAVASGTRIVQRDGKQEENGITEQV